MLQTEANVVEIRIPIPKFEMLLRNERQLSSDDLQTKSEIRISKYEKFPRKKRQSCRHRQGRVSSPSRKLALNRKLGNDDKKYDLEERTEKFSLRVRDFCGKLKRDIINVEYIRQLIKSTGSVAGNYIEANESLGNQDKKMHIKISRKEAKESKLWLEHVLT